MTNWYGLFRLAREQPGRTLGQGMVNFLDPDLNHTWFYTENNVRSRMTGSYDEVNNHLVLNEASERGESVFHVRAYSGRLIRVPNEVLVIRDQWRDDRCGLVGTYRDLRVAPEWATISPFVGAWYAMNQEIELRLYSNREWDYQWETPRLFADPTGVVEITGHWMMAREGPEGNGSILRFSIYSAVPEGARIAVAGEMLTLGAGFRPTGEQIPITGAYDPVANHLHFSEPIKQSKTLLTTRLYEARLISSGPVGTEGVARGWAGTHSDVLLEARENEDGRFWSVGRVPFTGGWFAEIDTREAYQSSPRPPTPHDAEAARP